MMQSEQAMRRPTDTHARLNPAAEDAQEAWEKGPSLGAVKRAMETSAAFEETADKQARELRAATWFPTLQKAVDRRRFSEGPRAQYPQGVRPLHPVLDWGKVLNIAGIRALGYTLPTIIVWGDRLITGTHRWVANEILQEAELPERIPVEDAADHGLAPLLAMMFDRGFGSSIIQDAVHHALGWPVDVDGVFWGMVMPRLLREAAAYATGGELTRDVGVISKDVATQQDPAIVRGHLSTGEFAAVVKSMGNPVIHLHIR